MSSPSLENAAAQKAQPRLMERIKANILPTLDNVTYTARRGLVKGMIRKGGLGFIPEFIGGDAGNQGENQFLEQLSLDGLVVYDIGAFQGLLTLFFSSRAKTRRRF